MPRSLSEAVACCRFRDPATGFVHLFTQFRLRSTDSIGWSHFVSKDLVRWNYLGEPIKPDGKDCPDIAGAFTGSATIVDGVPSLMYPGVHHLADGSIDMGQCLARPVDRSDPLLREWSKKLVIPSDSHKINSSRLHDDSAAWKGKDGRWWMFVGGSKVMVDSTRPRAKKYGLNLAYSSADFITWRREHSLFDIVTRLEDDGKVDKATECPFVSCPELYRAPGMAEDERVYEALCGKDRVWIGDWNESAVRFTPRPPPGAAEPQPHCDYDWGSGKASKSFTDPQTGRRLLWSWISGPVAPTGFNSTYLMDGMMSVPREVTWDAPTQQLLIVPAREVSLLRTTRLADAARVALVGDSGVIVPGCAAAGDALDILVNFSLAGLSGANASFGVRWRASSDGATFAAEARLELSRASADTPLTMTVTPAKGGSRLVPIRLVGAERQTQQHFEMRLLVDRPVTEVYAQAGRLRMSVPQRLNASYGAGVRVFGPPARRRPSRRGGWARPSCPKWKNYSN